MLKIRPQTKCSPRKNGIKKFPEFWPSGAGGCPLSEHVKNGIKKFPEFWPSRAGTERTEVKNMLKIHKVELDALSQNMLKIRPQTNSPPEKWN